jgi:hypothetical protein
MLTAHFLQQHTYLLKSSELFAEHLAPFSDAQRAPFLKKKKKIWAAFSHLSPKISFSYLYFRIFALDARRTPFSHDVHAALDDPAGLEAVGGSDVEGWDEIVDEG